MPPRALERSITTCRACRRKKIRCDKQKPTCEQCAASGITCEYESINPRKKIYRFVDETPSASSSHRTSQDETIGHSEPAPVAIPIERLDAIEARLDHLHDLVRQTAASQNVPRTLRSPPDVYEPVAEDVAASATADVMGKLSLQGDGRVRFVSPIFWAALCQESADLDDIVSSISTVADLEAYAEQQPLVDPQARQPSTSTSPTAEELSPPLRDLASSSTTRPNEQTHNLDTASAKTFVLRTHLPGKADCDLHLDAYCFNCHPIVPVVHVPTFRTRYENYWMTPTSTMPPHAALYGFQALMLALLYAGVASDPSSYQSDSRTRDRASQFHGMALKLVRMAGFPQRPTLDTLRAYLLCHGMPLKEEEPLANVAFVGLALRAANMMGLHLEPSRFPSISPLEAEERRRTWLHLVHIDVLMAIAAGLPPLISNLNDVRPLSELKERFIGTAEGQAYEDDIALGAKAPELAISTSMVSAAGILVAAKHKFTLAQRRFLQRLDVGFNDEAFQQMKERWVELGAYLHSARERIVLTADAQPTYEMNDALNSWAREIISIFLDQRYYLLCYPLLQSTPQHVSRELYDQTIISCLCFLIRCANLSSRNEWQCFLWSWPGNHQPIHALIIILNDFRRSPESSWRTMARNVVNVIISLCGPRGGLVGSIDGNESSMDRQLSDSGVELWSYIGRLRARTWRALGWDPTLDWNRKRAVECLNTDLLPTLPSLDVLKGDSNTVIDEIGQSGELSRLASMHVGGQPFYSPTFDWTNFDMDAIFEHDGSR